MLVPVLEEREDYFLKANIYEPLHAFLHDLT